MTLELTRKYGEMFTVLNMANAYIPGGKYREGSGAQEENMTRRTDLHWALTTGESGQMDQAKDAYHPSMTELLNAENGRVYLGETPRVCIRAGENTNRRPGEVDVGYEWLPEDDIFPFFELRAAAIDRRRADRTLQPFDDEMRQKTRQRIEAQLHTLREKEVKHVVLSAFGCGAFQKPPEEIAALYREVISEMHQFFHVIAFAIFAPGYGPNDNFQVFQKAFDNFQVSQKASDA